MSVSEPRSSKATQVSPRECQEGRARGGPHICMPDAVAGVFRFTEPELSSETEHGCLPIQIYSCVQVPCGNTNSLSSFCCAAFSSLVIPGTFKIVQGMRNSCYLQSIN